MKIQETNWDCGACAVLNALRCYNDRISSKKVRKACNSDPQKGTDEKDLVNGIAALGYVGHAFNHNKVGQAWEMLKENLSSGKPVILNVDKEQHWVTAIGIINDHVIIFDSNNTIKNLAENGIHVLSKRVLGKRWKDDAGNFYGVAVAEITIDKK